MFNQYDPNVKAVDCFLKLLNVKVNPGTVNETLQNHPDWPSMLCISDSLTKWNVPNAAARIETANIDELPFPFIAYTNNKATPLAIVTAVTENTVTYFSKSYTKPTNVSKEDFLTTWAGIYLIAEPSEASGEKDFKASKRKAFVNALIPTALFIILATLSFIGMYKTAVSAALVAVYLQWAILFAGVIVTSLLLWYEIDKNNPVLQKVCTRIVKGNCNAILTGRRAKLFSWLSWSEIGFFYFTGSLLTLSFIGSTAITILAWLNILALPYTVFSIYYQWQVAKQWCVLCLAVQALLLLGAANVSINNLLLPLNKLGAFSIIDFLLLYLLPILLWYAIKPVLVKLQAGKNTKREFLRIKFNTEIFNTLLKKQKFISLSTDGLGIDIGNANATNTLIKVCNPYCGPCAKAHSKIEQLLEEVPNLKAKIIFTTSNKISNPAYEPVSHLLAINEHDNGKINKALDDWYLPQAKDYEVFKTRYPMNGEIAKQGNKMEAMKNWCNAMEVNETPTIFINGYQLPDAYNIEDLQYFLHE